MKTNEWEISNKPSDIDKDVFIKICNDCKSMAQAARVMKLHFSLFKKYAEKYNCYKPNQAGIGLKKNINRRIETLESYATRTGVRGAILRDNLLEYKCDICGIDSWNGIELNLHLDHRNGDSKFHRLDNLRWLCPNCHSQTDTYTGRNHKTKPKIIKENNSLNKIENWKKIIEDNNIDFSKKTWGVELAKITGKSPQWCLKFTKSIPGLI